MTASREFCEDSHSTEVATLEKCYDTFKESEAPFMEVTK